MLKLTTPISSNKAPAAKASVFFSRAAAQKFTSFAGCKSADANAKNPLTSERPDTPEHSGVPVPCNPEPNSIAVVRSISDVIADIQSNPHCLRLRYPLEYNSWRAMKRRALEGFVVAPEFLKFEDFIRYVGPRPSRLHTLDRVDPFDDEYAPGKVRWLNKTGQTRNRRGTHTFQHPEVNRKFYAPDVAQMVGVKENTIRKWRRQGWSDRAIFMGRRLPADSAIDCTPKAPKDTGGYEARDLAQAFMAAAEAGFEDHVAQIVTGRHIGRTKAFIKARGDIVRPAMMHAVANWREFTDCAETDGGAYKSPAMPSLDFFLNHENVAVGMYRKTRNNIIDVANPFSGPRPIQHASIATHHAVTHEDDDEVSVEFLLAEMSEYRAIQSSAANMTG